MTEERSRLRVVLTLRADFYDRPLRHNAVGRLVRDATVAVLPLAPDELEHAIVDPAHSVGAEFEPGLVSEIVADVADQPGALPLLQYALTELYEQRVSGLLTRDAYRQLGGVAGALGRRAEELFEASSQDGQQAIRRMFGRLVSLGEGTEDTRRRALRSELGQSQAADQVIESYGAARLLSFDHDPVSREPTVEVAHEALLREWPRLREWLDDDRDGLRLVRHLHSTAEEWASAGRPDAELYRGGRLESAENWAAKRPDDLTAEEREFLTAAVELRRHEEAARQDRFDRERRSNRRLKTALAGVAILLTVALIAGMVAVQQRGAARASAAQAETERIAAEAASFAGEDLPLSLLLAVEAHRRDPGPAGLGALQTALSRSGSFLGFISMDGADAVHWVDEDTLLVSGSNGISLVDWRSGLPRSLAEQPVHQRVHVIGDGNTQLRTTVDVSAGTIAFARADDPSIVEVRSLDNAALTAIQATSPVDAVAVSDQGLVLTLDLDGWLIATETDGTEAWRVHAHPEVLEGDIDHRDLPPGTIDVLYGLPVPSDPTRTRNARPQLIELRRRPTRSVDGGERTHSAMGPRLGGITPGRAVRGRDQ